ncbi:DNA mismatch endonuclease Vsr [Bradyrhizobium elkanii]
MFVHGCFWHRHDCDRATSPSSNVEYWAAKFDRNVRRDARNADDLRKAGWRCVRIWECETKDAKKLARILRRKIATKPKVP